MNGKRTIGNEVSEGETIPRRRQPVDSDTKQYAVDEEPELRATVELEIQGKVDTNHPDTQRESLTRIAEERMAAREAEIQRTHDRFDRRADSDREARSRTAAARGSVERRRTFQRRAAAVDPQADPDTPDPREQLSQEQLATVNREALRLVDELDGWSGAAISRRLAERVVDGDDLVSAVVRVVDELQTVRGQVVPIGKLEDVSRNEVSIEGRVEVLWDADSPAIAQVGLIADDSGRTKFTGWVASDQPWIEEGERVRIHGAAKNWYDGRVPVALTGWTTVHFPERGRWWDG